MVRVTGRDSKTVRKIIKQYEQQGQEKPPELIKASSLNQYHAEIVSFLEADLSIVRIHEKLRNLGCSMAYSSVKRYVNQLKCSTTICVRFHSNPGEKAQVDFGYVGLVPDPNHPHKRKKAWIFNMRLSYSCLDYYDYYEVVFDQTVETFICCNEHAFRYFAGVPQVVKIDNLKAGILETHFYSVPFKYVGKIVEVTSDSKAIRIFYQDKQIALHLLQQGKGHFVTQTSYYPRYKYYTPDSPEYLSAYQAKMTSVDQGTDNLFAIIVQKHPRDWYRVVKGILSLRKKYSNKVMKLRKKMLLV